MVEPVYNCKDLHQLVGLRVVRGPDWDYDTQDGGEGSVGTVVGVVGNAQNPRNVFVRWDSGEICFYRIGAEDAHDLRVLDNSTVGIKHLGVKCEGCNRQDIAGLRWQCLNCPTLTNLCTFCFTNEKHDQSHADFRRYDQPSSNPILLHLNDKPKIQLKGIFPGALVRIRIDWKYSDEDGGTRSVGKVVPSPNGQHGGTPGKVWVQWPHEKDQSYSYCVGFNGEMDLKIAKAGVGGRYQPHTLPILKISKPKLNEKTNDVALPLVVGDKVKFAVGLEELREMFLDCGLRWNPAGMKELVNEVGEVKKVNKKNNTVRVFDNKLAIYNFGGFFLGFFLIPEKALKRLIPWLPVDSVVQVSNGTDMVGNFGRVKKVNSDGTTVEMKFLESGENRTIPVSQLEKEIVDTSLIKKVESIRKDLAKLLVMEVDKGAILSVEYLMQNYPNIVNCRSSYNGKNCTALSVACQKGNLEIVKLLLQYNASVNLKDIKNKDDEDEDDDDDDEDDEDENDEDENYDDDEKYNRPIHHAVLGNHPEILKHLLENGASPNHKNVFRDKPPLHLAAKYGYVECLKLLLEDERCDPKVKNCNDKTAFEVAVDSSVQSLEILKLLYDAAIKLNITKKHFNANIFRLAILENNIKAVNFMLNNCQEGKIFAKQIDRDGDTTLNLACLHGHNQIAKLLVSQAEKQKNGKPWGIDTPNKKGRTPLMEVIEKGNYELIEFLIEAGANLQVTDKKGHTPFHYAARLLSENKKSSLINWPSEKTAPQISELYNELESKHPGHNLCPAAAIVYYLASKGGIPTTTLRDIKNLISDDFLFGEISQMCHNGHSMVQNVEECPGTFYESISSLYPPFQEQQFSSNSQENLNCQSQPQVSTNQNNGNNHRNLDMLINAASTSQPHQFNSTDTTQQPNNFEHSQITLEEETMATMTSHQEQPSQNGMANSGDYNNSITQQQQPHPSSLQQLYIFIPSEPIMANPNVPLTMTSTTLMPANTDTTTSSILPTSTDNNILEQAGERERNMDEMRSLPHATTVDTSTIDPAKAGTLVTCRIEEKKKIITEKDGSEIEKISWILIDDQNRRYSQQKKNVSKVFQCTANVYSIQNNNKKCKGSIRIPGLDLPKLEELKKDPGKNVCKFTVGNAHEEHLPGKRGRQSASDTESDISSTSGKRKKKT